MVRETVLNLLLMIMVDKVDLVVEVESLMVLKVLEVKVHQAKDMMVVQELDKDSTLEVVAVEQQLQVDTEIVQMVQLVQEVEELEYRVGYQELKLIVQVVAVPLVMVFLVVMADLAVAVTVEEVLVDQEILLED